MVVQYMVSKLLIHRLFRFMLDPQAIPPLTEAFRRSVQDDGLPGRYNGAKPECRVKECVYYNELILAELSLL